MLNPSDNKSDNNHDYKEEEEQFSESEHDDADDDDGGDVLQWNHFQKRKSLEFNEVQQILLKSQESHKKENMSNDDGDDEDDDDISTDDFSVTSSDEDEDEDDVNDEGKHTTNKPSLYVRIINIDCNLPPKLCEISSSFVPTFQLGFVKESKKNDFVSGTNKSKSKMSNIITSSSHVINRIEELRWDTFLRSKNNNSKNDNNIFLGVEMRIWGWFPEDLEKCEKSNIEDKNNNNNNVDENITIEKVAAAVTTAKEERGAGHNNCNLGMESHRQRRSVSFEIDKEDTTYKDDKGGYNKHHQVMESHHQRGRVNFLNDSGSIRPSIKLENYQQRQNQNVRQDKITVHSSSSVDQQHHFSTASSSQRSEKKIPSLRLGSLLIPIKSIEENYPVENTYTLDFKVAGGTKKMRKLIEEFLVGVTPPVVTLKLQIQISSLQGLNTCEDNSLLKNLRSFNSNLLQNGNIDFSSIEERLENMEVGGGGKFNTRNIGTSELSGTVDRRAITPELKPGIIDFICIVAPRDIDKLKTNDNVRNGWLPTFLKYNIVEQFPSETFYPKNGRNVELMEQIGWWCFPEGCQAWRGTEPPNAADMNLPSRNHGNRPNINGVHSNAPNASFFSTSSSTQAFDECFNCTTTFTWFVLQSRSDEVGSRAVKNHGICLRFFVPTMQHNHELWIPTVLCITTTLPIVGVIEAVLLRICHTLCNRHPRNSSIQECFKTKIYKDLANMIINYPSPVQGVLNCSMPFLHGHRLQVSLPPLTGLPPLPHGGSVTAVCRLLGAESFTVLLAAFLTESKILLHSHDISNLTMVAEVFYALIYPFQYVFTYIPVLPEEKLEIIEAPGVWFLGVSSKVMKWVDDQYLSDVVVIDLDNGFHTPDYFDRSRAYKLPSPLPAAVCQSIHNCISRLLRKEDNLEDEYRKACYPTGFRLLPRLENESRAEREFRIDLAIQICSLLRGYQDALLSIGEGQPLFIHDKFLRYAPALFEERTRDISSTKPDGSFVSEKQQTQATASQTLSPRSKRFLSLLVRTQHFQCLLESLEMDELNFFHKIMGTFEWSEVGDQRRDGLSNRTMERRKVYLSVLLEEMEGSIPTYHIDRSYFDKCFLKAQRSNDSESNTDQDEEAEKECKDGCQLSYDCSESSDDVDMLDLFEDELNQNYDISSEFCREKCLVTLDKDPWHYERIFPTKDEYEAFDGIDYNKISKVWSVCPKIKLREAIGEERYKAYFPDQQIGANDKEIKEDASALDGATVCESIDTKDTTHVSVASGDDEYLDLNILLSLAKKEMKTKTLDETNHPLYQCLSNVDSKNEKLIQNAEEALRSPSTYLQSQIFLLCVLSQRKFVDSSMKQPFMHRTLPLSQKSVNSTGNTAGAKLNPTSFKILIRLFSSMLDVCLERNLYENAYRLLSSATDFFYISAKATSKVINMTSTISVHPIFADLRLWEKVFILHLNEQHNQSTSTKSGFDLKNAPSTRSEVCNDDKNNFCSNYPNQVTTTGSYSSAVTKSESEHDAAVTTLYEMLSYGMPAEELFFFANRVSEARTDLGKKIVVIAKMIGLRRDETATIAATDDSQPQLTSSQDAGVASDYYGIKGGKYSDLMGTYHPTDGETSDDYLVEHGVLSLSPEKKILTRWKELSWFHPTSFKQSVPGLPQHPDVTLPRGYVGRTPITSICNFSSHFCIATGGLDGSVFFAHTLSFGSLESRKPPSVRGIQLEWGHGSTPSTNPDTKPYLSKAVTCLASSVPSQHYKPSSDHPDEILKSLDGCFIIAGTNTGSLNVWNVYDIYYSNVVALGDTKSGGSSRNPTLPRNSSILSNVTELTTSMELQHSRPTSIISEKTLDSTLRGKALRGHKKGVLCIDVPSTIYRPYTVATGGADGQIKLWSLRNTSATSSSHHRTIVSKPVGIPLISSHATESAVSNTDSCVSVLSGHNGKVLCLRTYWHGDQILSGGSDKTVRLWDLTTNSSAAVNRCLQTFTCHSGDVTQVHCRGSNIVVSASTDRTIAICDARVGALPVHVLRYHKAHISDLLLGPRSDNIMISASGDGTIATWDLRSFQTSNVKKQQDLNDIKILRSPVAIMSHITSTSRSVSGSITLSRGILSDKTIFSASIDSIVKEWNIVSGTCIGEMDTGHSGAISCLSSYSEHRSKYYDSFRSESSFYGNISCSLEESSSGNDTYGGVLTCSWDGSIRFRKCNELL